MRPILQLLAASYRLIEINVTVPTGLLASRDGSTRNRRRLRAVSVLQRRQVFVAEEWQHQCNQFSKRGRKGQPRNFAWTTSGPRRSPSPRRSKSTSSGANLTEGTVSFPARALIWWSDPCPASSEAAALDRGTLCALLRVRRFADPRVRLLSTQLALRAPP
jgi:hypothetical protein